MEWIEIVMYGLFALVGLLIVCMVLYGVYSALDYLLAHSYTKHPAHVVERSYSPSQTSVGVGPTSTGGTVTTISSTAAEWILVCQLDDQSIHPFSIDEDTWGRCKKGTAVDVAYWVGRFSGRRRGWELWT
jgi:hypothetical protein